MRKVDKMPRFPIGAIASNLGSFSASLIDRNGEIGSVSLELLDTVTDAEAEAVGLAVADVSNAGLLSYGIAKKTAVNPKNTTAYDEAESSVASKAELVFADNSLRTRSVSVPAPDAQFIVNKVVQNTGAMATLISAIELVLNGGAGGSGTFVYQRGYFVSRTRKTSKGVVTPNFTEPGLQAPSDAPGT